MRLATYFLQVHSQAVKEEVSEPDAAPVAPTPVVEEIPAPKEQGVHMTAAGKAAAAAKAAVRFGHLVV